MVTAETWLRVNSEAYLVLKAKNSVKDLKSQMEKGKKGKKNIESVSSEAGPDLDGIESECPMSKCKCAGWGKYEEAPPTTGVGEISR